MELFDLGRDLGDRKYTLLAVAYVLLFILGISILMTSAGRRDIGLIVIVLLFTVIPVAYFILLFKNKKNNGGQS